MPDGRKFSQGSDRRRSEMERSTVRQPDSFVYAEPWTAECSGAGGQMLALTFGASSCVRRECCFHLFTLILAALVTHIAASGASTCRARSNYQELASWTTPRNTEHG